MVTQNWLVMLATPSLQNQETYTLNLPENITEQAFLKHLSNSFNRVNPDPKKIRLDQTPSIKTFTNNHISFQVITNTTYLDKGTSHQLTYTRNMTR